MHNSHPNLIREEELSDALYELKYIWNYNYNTKSGVNGMQQITINKY